MELYGGGMVGKSNNYQLGGQIARSRRRRDFQGEMRKLRQKQEMANRRKKKSSFLGSIGSLAGGAIGSLLGPAGTAIGAGLGRRLGEGTYQETDYGNGKYAKETREDLGQAEKDYQRGMTERALVSGLQAAIMPGIYDKAGSYLGKAGSYLDAKFGNASGLPMPKAPEELLSANVGNLGDTLPFSMADPASAMASYD